MNERFGATTRFADLALDQKADAGIRTGTVHDVEADVAESRTTRL